MLRVLFICRDLSQSNNGGIAVVKRNLSFVSALSTNSNVTLVQIPIPSLFTRIKNILLRESYGDTRSVRSTLLYELNNNYDLVFFDSSLYGVYVKRFYKKGFRVFCFYHNIEFNYYSSKYMVDKSLSNRLIIPFIKYNEYLSTKYSVKRIVLNMRDAQELKRIYGYAADLILPTSFEENELSEIVQTEKVYCLFVGSNFFSNQEGICWFIKEIAPFVSLDIRIVGTICDCLRNRGDLGENVYLEGFVDNIDSLYQNALCVISPILSGSGLKTKTVEALKYGKTILGTTEAFQGIDGDYNQIGKLCNTANEFIEGLNQLGKNEVRVNEYSLNLFREKYSNKAVFNVFKKFFFDLC